MREEALDLNKISQNISRFLKEKKLNLKKLGDLTNLPITTLSPILHGKRDFRLSNLVAIADALHVTPNELLLGAYRFSRNNQQEVDEPQYVIAIIANASFSYLHIFNGAENSTQSLMLSFSILCIYDADELIEKIKLELERILGDLNFKAVALYVSVLCYEYIDGKNALLKKGKEAFFKFIIEPDWLTIHKSVLAQTDGILLVINNGYALSYSTDRGETIHKHQGYGFPLSDEAGNIWLGCQALKHAINVKEGIEKRTLLSDKILALFKSDLNLITTRVYDDYITTYTEAAVIVKELSKKINKAEEIVKSGFENIWKHVQWIDKTSGEKLPISLAGDLAYLYEEFFPKERLKKIDSEQMLDLQFQYATNLLRDSRIT